MKIRKSRRVGQALAIMVGLVGLVAMVGCHADSAGTNSFDVSFAKSQQKIDPGLMVTLRQLEQSQHSQQEIQVLVQTRGQIDATQRAALERNGVKIGSVLGDVLTATASARVIFEIARLDFVIHIEMSKPERLR